MAGSKAFVCVPPSEHVDTSVLKKAPSHVHIGVELAFLASSDCGVVRLAVAKCAPAKSFPPECEAR